MLGVKLLVVVMCQTLRVSMAMQCTRCAPGKFKSPDMLFEPCTNCAANTYSSRTARTNASTCIPCFDNSVSAAGSDSIDDCSCSSGFEFS